MERENRKNPYYETSTTLISNRIHPKAFQAGDIVETLISIVGVPIKNQRIKIIITLRGLNLLSCGLRKVSHNNM